MSLVALLLPIVVFFASPAFASSPDEAVCGSPEGASAIDRARQLGEFYRAINLDISTDPRHHLTCLAEKTQDLEPHVSQYCLGRAAKGHGLVAEELWHLSNEIEAALWECEEDAQEPFMARTEAPLLCNDIEAYLRESLPMLAGIKSPEQIECMRRAIPTITDRLSKSCPPEPIPAKLAFGFWDVLAAECPAPTE